MTPPPDIAIVSPPGVFLGRMWARVLCRVLQAGAFPSCSSRSWSVWGSPCGCASGTSRATVSGDDLARRGWDLLDGVVETRSAYRFEPLGIVVPKGASDMETRLRASGMVSQTGPWWSPALLRSHRLPTGACTRSASWLFTTVGRSSRWRFCRLPSPQWASGRVRGAPSPSDCWGDRGALPARPRSGARARPPLGGAVQPAILTTRGADAALVRPTLTGRREVVVVCAGPGAPLLVGFPLLLLWQTCWPLVVAWLLVSAAHLGALVVPVGDGANLRRALRRPLARADRG